MQSAIKSPNQQQQEMEMDGDDDEGSIGSDTHLGYAWDIEEFYNVNCVEISDDEDEQLTSFYNKNEKEEDVIDLRDESDENSPDYGVLGDSSHDFLPPPPIEGMDIFHTSPVICVNSSQKNEDDSPIICVDSPKKNEDDSPIICLDSPQKNEDDCQIICIDSPQKNVDDSQPKSAVDSLITCVDTLPNDGSSKKGSPARNVFDSFMNCLESPSRDVAACSSVKVVTSSINHASPKSTFVSSKVDSHSVSDCVDDLAMEVDVQEAEVHKTEEERKLKSGDENPLTVVEKLNPIEDCNELVDDEMEIDTGNNADVDSDLVGEEYNTNNLKNINVAVPLSRIEENQKFVSLFPFSYQRKLFVPLHKTALNLVKNAIPLIRHVVDKMNEKPKLVSVRSSSSSTSVGSSKHELSSSSHIPSQYHDDQMGLMKRLVDAKHGPSVQNLSRMLLSSMSYPSGELLSFFMQNLVLDAEVEKSAQDALKFLNFTLTTHDPARRYIKKDHIYLQAMTLSNDYKPPTAAKTKIPVNERTMIWSKTVECSIQWNFVSTVLRTALSSSNKGRSKHNAILLLNHFLGRLIATDHKTLRKLFSWKKHAPIRSTFALNELCSFYLESLMITIEPRNILATSSAGEETFDEQGFVVPDEKTKKLEDAMLVSKTLLKIILATTDFIRSTDGGEKEGLTVIANSLANEVKNMKTGKRHVLLHRLLTDLKYNSLGFHVACSFFRKTCAPMLSTEGQGPNLDLEDDSGDLCSRIHDYLCFIPRVDLRLYPKNSSSKNRRKRWSDRSHGGDEYDGWSSDEKNSSHMTKKQQQTRGRRNKKSGNKLRKKQQQIVTNHINKRNNKGETELHKACLHNKPDRVREILLTPGVDPNAPCNAGWTPLAEACSRGNIACVRELLSLPLGTANPGNSDTGVQPTLCIDLFACPESEGLTPLHDAVENGHHEVVRLLLEKGGHNMLFKPHNQSGAPIDMCETQEQRDIFEQIAHELSLNEQNRNNHHQTCDTLSNGHMISELLPDESKYNKVIPSITSAGAGNLWIDACRCYGVTVHHLLMSYINKTHLHEIICQLVLSKQDGTTHNDVIERFELEGIPAKISRVEINPTGDESAKAERVVIDRVESPHVTRVINDVLTLLLWDEVQKTFNEHLKRLSTVSRWTHRIDWNLNIFPSDYIDKLLSEALKSFQIALEQ